MQPLTAIVLGATGLIGGQLVERLLNDDDFEKVKILVRRPVELANKKLEVQIVNFDNLADFRAKLGSGDCIFCCIGTTQKQVKGDKTAYRKVDFDIPVNAAKMGKDAGFKKYLLVSSVGAKASARNFYLKLKGEVEKAIAEQHFESFHVFRPSMLLGDRKEVRLG
ncbi:MAG: NAD(P)H-binding protein, partial [Segetibacter sp.]|nr:NAD(P)H-binding protein [Segetibacter sp.]